MNETVRIRNARRFHHLTHSQRRQIWREITESVDERKPRLVQLNDKHHTVLSLASRLGVSREVVLDSYEATMATHEERRRRNISMASRSN